LLPAIERYDGPPFKVLRRFLRHNLESPLDVFVLSAEFGLIAGDRSLPSYDRRMRPERARELRPIVIAKLAQILLPGRHRELFISLGRDYLAAVEGYQQLVPADLTVRVGAGGQGRKLAALHGWLHEDGT
jgi:hypothetical protein